MDDYTFEKRRLVANDEQFVEHAFVKQYGDLDRNIVERVPQMNRSEVEQYIAFSLSVLEKLQMFPLKDYLLRAIDGGHLTYDPGPLIEYFLKCKDPLLRFRIIERFACTSPIGICDFLLQNALVPEYTLERPYFVEAIVRHCSPASALEVGQQMASMYPEHCSRILASFGDERDLNTLLSIKPTPDWDWDSDGKVLEASKRKLAKRLNRQRNKNGN